MEHYLIYAIISIFFGGFLNFVFKIVSKRKYDSTVVTIYSYSVMTLVGGVFFLFTTQNLENINIAFPIFLAFLNAVFFTSSIFARIESLKNIDAVIFFPIYKTVLAIFITIISVLFFKESLTVKEVLGVLIGISVPLLLITKAENKLQTNMLTGIIFLLIAAAFTLVSSSAGKQLMVNQLNVGIYVFASGLFGLIFSIISCKLTKRTDKTYNTKGIKKIGSLCGILHTGAFIMYIKALEGNFAVVSVINSFSILIPIILSIIFYNEDFNLRKGLIIALSIISIILFV